MEEKGGEAKPRGIRSPGRRDYPSNVNNRKRERRARVAKLYISGTTNRRQLAATVGCSMATIIKDIQYLKKVWEREASELINEEKYLELMRLQRLEEEANRAYEESRKPEEMEEATTVQHPDGSQSHKATVRKRKRYGDVGILKTIMEISRERSRVLGLREAEKNVKHGVTKDGFRMLVSGIDQNAHLMTDDELQEMIEQRKLADAEARRLRQQQDLVILEEETPDHLLNPSEVTRGEERAHDGNP